MGDTITGRYQRLTVSAVGMHCGACEKLVTMMAKQVEGVVAASGDATASTLTVYTDQDVLQSALADAVVAAGFTPGDPFVVENDYADELPDTTAPRVAGPVAIAEAIVAEAEATACPAVPQPVAAPLAAAATAPATPAGSGRGCATPRPQPPNGE